MAKLTRYLQKIFANNSNQVGVFGTGVDKETSKNVETLQSADYENGWSSAIITNKNYPIWQERDGVDYGFSYQLAYLMQAGLPEWLSTETYYTNSFCRYGNDIYYSLQDDNTNHNPALNDGWWEKFSSGSSRNIGEIVPSTIPLTDAGLHLLDGALIQGSGSYSAFVDYMADLYDSGDYPDLFDTEANWQASVTQYGVCDKFVYDSVNNTVRLPKYGNQIITKTSAISTASTVPVVGNGVTLGLTNGTNTYGLSWNGGSPKFYATLSNDAGSSVGTSSGSNLNGNGLTFGVTTDPTKSGLVADISSIKNYPLDCYYYIVIATTTKTQIQVDIDEIATDLNGKADVSLSNTNNTAKILMSGMGMPSTTYDDLTLGAAGTTYTAPANGWFTFGKSFAASGNNYVYIALLDENENYFMTSMSRISVSGQVSVYMPVAKGDKVQVDYSGGGTTTTFFRFVYAIGSESEAS